MLRRRYSSVQDRVSHLVVPGTDVNVFTLSSRRSHVSQHWCVPVLASNMYSSEVILGDVSDRPGYDFEQVRYISKVQVRRFIGESSAVLIYLLLPSLRRCYMPRALTSPGGPISLMLRALDRNWYYLINNRIGVTYAVGNDVDFSDTDPEWEGLSLAICLVQRSARVNVNRHLVGTLVRMNFCRVL
jgi:hypothetical protein